MLLVPVYLILLLPLSSCLGCIPPLIGLPSLRFYAVGSSLFLLSVYFCLCFLFYRDDVLCWLLPCPSFSVSMLISDSRFDLIWFRLSCDHGWVRSGSVNVRKQHNRAIRPCHPSHSMPLALILPRGGGVCVCVCVYLLNCT